MTNREDKKFLIIYPEDSFKGYWDMYITLVLMITCVTTPMDIAFSENNGDFEINVFSLVIDLMFLMDMVVIFNTAFYDIEVDIVDSRKQIAKSYILSWFFIDLLAIIPFDIILNYAT
jgi:hypothetical protein